MLAYYRQMISRFDPLAKAFLLLILFQTSVNIGAHNWNNVFWGVFMMAVFIRINVLTMEKAGLYVEYHKLWEELEKEKSKNVSS